MKTQSRPATFEEWLREVDREVIRRSSLSLYDLPDCCYRDWYDDGMSVRSAASKSLKNARE